MCLVFVQVKSLKPKTQATLHVVLRMHAHEERRARASYARASVIYKAPPIGSYYYSDCDYLAIYTVVTISTIYVCDCVAILCSVKLYN